MNKYDRVTKPLTRREFLKFASLLPILYTLPSTRKTHVLTGTTEKPNVLLLVFDAWSASNISLYGYPRPTTPHLEHLAQRAIVYHNHFAGGHYTTPGTASLLTGTTPWIHQAFDFNETVIDSFSRNSIFYALSDYHRLAYSHNPLVETLLRQFMVDIDDHTPFKDLYLKDPLSLINYIRKDVDIGTISQNRILNQADDGVSYSLYLSRIYETLSRSKMENLLEQFPRGITNYGDYNYFILEDAIDWLSESLKDSPTPFFGYYHFNPPHDPYYTRHEFVDAFSTDPYQVISKDPHFFSNKPRQIIKEQQRWYDEFILYVDAEIARLFTTLETEGMLKNTWIIITSDHGEMFERNILGHSEPVFYQPLMRIPLLILPPHGETRTDIYTKTSAIDLLPTICHITGQQTPSWTEGELLPGIKEAPLPRKQAISSVQVESIDKDAKIDQATAVLVQDQYKFVWYFGYDQIKPESEYMELYDIDSDPEEVINLVNKKLTLAEDFKSTLMSKLSVLNLSSQRRKSS